MLSSKIVRTAFYTVPLMKTAYRSILPFVTKDGSEIRELMHPKHHAPLGVRTQSLAEAIVVPGAITLLHLHRASEEIYHVTQGTGRMTLGARQFDVEAGDSVCIPPGTPHCIECVGGEALKILCLCSPPYAHEDTEIL
jgi:mannose-6-phosphate isomerase-like protein (cupin superfamily)